MQLRQPKNAVKVTQEFLQWIYICVGRFSTLFVTTYYSYIGHTSVMIIIVGASLTEQDTNLSLHKAGLNCHAQVDIYVSQKPTARTATVSVAMYAWTKLYTKVISCICDVYKCRLCMSLTWSDLNHRDRICTACEQPAVRSKLPCVLQLQSSQLQVTDATLSAFRLHTSS